MKKNRILLVGVLSFYALSLFAWQGDIQSIDLVQNGKDFTFIVEGEFSKDSHFAIYVDSDNNPQTGYSKGVVKGADYLIEDRHLYRYPVGASGWNWKKISSDVTFKADRKKALFTLSSELLSVDSKMHYIASISSKDWKERHFYTTQREYEVANNSFVHELKSVTFTQIASALKNPLKGFMIWPNDTKSPHEYVSLVKKVIPWNRIENSIDDGVSKIVSYSKDKMYDNFYDSGKRHNIAQKNIKAIPIVVLKKRRSDDFSPSDMDISEHDNQTDEFVRRINNLVPKLAKAWDDDPRIGFVYMGIVGTWGEQYSTVMSPEVAKALGDGFSKYFKNKKVLVRIPNYFDKTYLTSHNNSFRGNTYTNYYSFGMYWDAFAWSSEMRKGGLDTFNLIKNAKLWQNQPILGEVAFNVNYVNIHDYDDYPDLAWPQNSQHAIHDTLTDELSFDYLRDYIKATHATALSWISTYNKNDQQELRAAQKLQKEMGYRFVLEDAKFNSFVGDDRKLSFSFGVKNVGSAPFYYNWPVEVSLLDIDSKKVVFKKQLDNVDIRDWQPGDDWDFQNNRYKTEAKTYIVNDSIEIPKELKEGEYILSLAILDPSSMKPALKFAVTNYYKGGRTALGVVGVNRVPSNELSSFDDIIGDELFY
jgi:hypothetical protein